MSARLLVSIRELAEEWGVSYPLVSRLVRTGELGSVQIARRRMVPRAEANRYIRAHYARAALEAQDAGELVTLEEHRRAAP